jgi:hypothetical protein
MTDPKDPLGLRSKLNHAPVEEETVVVETIDDGGDPLGLRAALKKKVNAVPASQDSEIGTTSPISTELSKPSAPVTKPSAAATPEPKKEVGFTDLIKSAWESMVKDYNTPETEEKKDDPIISAAKRGWNLGDQAEILSPYTGTNLSKDKIKELADTQIKASKLPASKEYQEFSNASGFGDALTKLAKNPATIIGELTAESLASMANYGSTRMAAGAGLGALGGSVIPGIGTAAGAGAGVIVGLADTSLALEYSGKFMDTLKENGVDVSSPESLEKAFANPELMDNARTAALKKGIPIAIFDLISGGVAGKILKPGTTIARKIAKGAGEAGIQAALGGSGEVAGELASGEKINPAAVLGEMVGEIGTTPVEVAANTIGDAKTVMTEPSDQVVNQVTDGLSADNIDDVKAAADVVAANASVKTVDQIVDSVKDQPIDTPAVQAPTLEATVEEQPTTVTDEEASKRGQGQQEGLLIPEGQVADVGASATTSEPVTTTNEQQTETNQVQQVNPVSAEATTISDSGGEGLVGGSQQVSDEDVHGIKKVLITEDKIGSTPLEKRSTQTMLTNAKKEIDSGNVNPTAIISEFVDAKKPRALQANEVAAMVYHKVDLDGKLDAINQKIEQAREAGDPEQLMSLEAQRAGAEKQIDDYHTMALESGYEQGLAFRLRQMLLNNEYELTAQIRKYKANNKGQISPEVEDKFRDLDRQLKEANAKIKEFEDGRNSKESELALRSIKDRMKAGRPRQARGKALISEGFSDLNDIIRNSATLGIVADSKSEGKNQTQQIIKAFEKIGKGLIDEGLATVENLGEKLREYVKDKFGGKLNFDDYEKEVLVNVAESMPKATVKDGKVKIPKSLIYDLVESGVGDINDLTKTIHNNLKSEHPELTERDVRDAITDYGKTVTMSKDEIDVKIRELKRVGKLVSGLEDAADNKRPQRSGLQRDKPTDEERKMQRELKEKIKDIPLDEAELDKNWKNALDTVKSRLKNQIADLQDQITKGDKSPKKKGIDYDDEANALKAQRDELKSVIEELEGKSEMSDEERVRRAISSAEKSLENYERRIKDKDFSSKKSTPAPETPELKTIRAKRDAAKRAFQELEKEYGIADKKRLAAVKKGVQKQIDEFQRRIKEGDFSKKVKNLPVDLDEEAKKLRRDQTRIKEEYDIAQEKNRLANRPLSERTSDTIKDAANIPKSLQASLDFSAVLRQGAMLSAGHPIIAAKSFIEMFRQTFSSKRAKDWMSDLRDTDAYSLMKSSDLYLSEPSVKLSAREEQFLSNFAERIPIIGKSLRIGKFKIPGLDLIGGSNRAYSGYLNKLRSDVFINGVDRLQEQDITFQNNPEAYKKWASFINNATGRGNLGAVEKHATSLNALFFSPRYVASRFNLLNRALNPYTYFNTPWAVKKMELHNMLSFIGFYLLYTAINSAAGADVEWDPRSTNFLKMAYGNLKKDILGGFSQDIRYIVQVLTNERKSKSGITKIGENWTEGAFNTSKKFARTKLAPIPSAIINLGTGTDLVGNEVIPKDEALRLVTPMVAQDIRKITNEYGPTGLITVLLPSIFGEGNSIYKEYEPKEKSIKSQIKKGMNMPDIRKEIKDGMKDSKSE